jgi:hypothetical protein
MEYKVRHRPILNVAKVCDLYSEKDGVPIYYVCTTAKGSEAFAKDIFYRETPHPEFGNKYFALFVDTFGYYISNADWVEELTFDCIFVGGKWCYSRHRHDFLSLSDGSFIDGGRAYTRMGGKESIPEMKTFVVRNGRMVPNENS